MSVTSLPVNLEYAARVARNAARLVAIALCAVAVLALFQSGPLPALGLAIAAGTLSHTAATLHVVTDTLATLLDDRQLDHDIIECQQELIAVLRQERSA